MISYVEDVLSFQLPTTSPSEPLLLYCTTFQLFSNLRNCYKIPITTNISPESREKFPNKLLLKIQKFFSK